MHADSIPLPTKQYETTTTTTTTTSGTALGKT
jgi:hypothetical protein